MQSIIRATVLEIGHGSYRRTSSATNQSFSPIVAAVATIVAIGRRSYTTETLYAKTGS